MRIAWITNQATPDISLQIGESAFVGGGWMNKLSLQISKENELSIIFPISDKQNSEVVSGKTKGVLYYGIPMKKDRIKESQQTLSSYNRVLKEIQPDVVHIWGTEYVHSWDAVRACMNLGIIDRTVISIQGLVSVYTKHFWCGINYGDIPRFTIKDLIFKSSLSQKYKAFCERGIYEKKAIENVRHIIGRTDWDRACAEQYNSSIEYHFCNETLRESFYHFCWDISECKRHTIFVSQSQYPIKGFHIALEAVAILKKKWPDIKLITTGKSKTHCSTKELLRLGDYDLFLRKRITELGLEDNVEFVGMLNEEKMCEQYLKAHVFLSASSIENSPNSVGEAMVLGMPVVSSDVGGVKNMLVHEKEGYIYQSDAPYMAAYYIDRFFSDDEIAVRCGKMARQHALKTHDANLNYDTMLNIYKDISGQ